MQTPPHGHYRTYGWVCIERCFLNWVSVIMKFHQPTFFQVRWGTFSSGNQNFPEYFCEFCRVLFFVGKNHNFFPNKLRRWSIFLNFSIFQNFGRKKAGTGFLLGTSSDDVTCKKAASLLLGGNVLLCIPRCLWLLFLLLINWVPPPIYLFISLDISLTFTLLDIHFHFWLNECSSPTYILHTFT